MLPEVGFALVLPQSGTVLVYCQAEASCAMGTALEVALEELSGCCSAAPGTEHRRQTDCEAPGSCTSEDEALHIVEGIWQNRLATFEQHGSINVRDELTTNYRSTALDFFDL